MGIDRTVSFGLGLLIPEKNFLGEVIPDFDDDPWGSTYDYFKENYPGLELIESGDSMGGDSYWILIVSGLSDSVEAREMDGGFFPLLRTTDETVLARFAEAYEKLTGEAGKVPQSFVSFHVY